MRPLEVRWDAMLNHFDHFTILVVGTFLLHEFVYFTRYIPFWICDQIPALRKYKIQQVRAGVLNPPHPPLRPRPAHTTGP